MTRRLLGLGFAVIAVLLLLAADSNIHYFTKVRPVQVKDTSRQNYLVVDPEIWAHSREDLGDLRLYVGTRAIPYALHVQGGESYSVPRTLKVLNLGKTSTGTTFLLDMEGLAEYDEITLDIDRKDFVARATVEGGEQQLGAKWTTLATGPLFDYSREKLGSNTSLRIPLSSFRYLRVVISGPVEAKDIKGASGADTARVEAAWDVAPVNVKSEEKDRTTVITFDVPQGVPIDRLRFVVPEDLTNFRRAVQVRTLPEEVGSAISSRPVAAASGEISRVRVRQGNHTETCENLDIPMHGDRDRHWGITIDNGDDPPLPVRIVAETLQRRLYFDPQGASALQLFYGDEKLSAPVYDYAKFFNPRETKDAVAAALGAGQHNPQYTGRPDERPWSERHGWVLWVAMAVAIVGVGAVALRGLKSA